MVETSAFRNPVVFSGLVPSSSQSARARLTVQFSAVSSLFRETCAHGCLGVEDERAFQTGYWIRRFAML